MLVLTRKVGETVMIGDDIALTITRVERDRVRLSFSAPEEIVILRRELYEQILRDGIGEKVE